MSTRIDCMCAVQRRNRIVLLCPTQEEHRCSPCSENWDCSRSRSRSQLETKPDNPAGSGPFLQLI